VAVGLPAPHRPLGGASSVKAILYNSVQPDSSAQRRKLCIYAALLLLPLLGGKTLQAGDERYSGLKLESGKQLYEAACVACHGRTGQDMPESTIVFKRPDTRLLAAIGYLKDNRDLPYWLDKAETQAHIRVQSGAAEDLNFSKQGYRVRYPVAVGTARAPFALVLAHETSLR
jgi:hypothetical protein